MYAMGIGTTRSSGMGLAAASICPANGQLTVDGDRR